MKLLTTVPFSGFYCTDHEDAKDYEEYAKAYTNQIDIELEFESLDSPKEYNFTSDRIFAKIHLETAKNLLNTVDKERFSTVCKNLFTSYDGFISHYDTEWIHWGNIKNWDHNQLGALLQASLDEDFEDRVFDVLRGNGYINYEEDYNECV